MTVAELRVRMSTAEYGEWQGYHRWKKAAEREMDKRNRRGG